MAIKSLSAKTLHKLAEGGAGRAIDAEIKKALDDTMDRGPEDGTVREVNIKIQIQYTDEDEVAFAVTASSKLPPYKTPATVAEVRKIKPADGPEERMAVFSDVNRKRPDQPNLPGMNGDGEEAEEAADEK